MTYAFDDYQLDDRRRVLMRDGEAVSLQRLPFDVLVYLIRHRDRVVSAEELLDVIWAGRRISSTSLPRCIHAIRRALNDPSRGGSIETAHGSGYRFSPQLVTVVRGVAAADKGAPAVGSEDCAGLLRTGRELIQSGEFETARPILLRASILARQNGDSGEFAETALAFSESFAFLLPVEILKELLEEAAGMPQVAHGMKARLEARLALVMVGHGDATARDAYAEAALARSVPLHGPERLRVLLDVCRAYEGLGSHQRRTPLMREIRTLHSQSCHGTTKLEFQLAELVSVFRPETFGRFAAGLAEYAELVREAPPRFRVLPTASQASVAALRGHSSEASALLDDATKLVSSSREDAVLLDGNRWHIERRRERVPASTAGLRFPFDVPDQIRAQMVLLLCDVGARGLARRQLEPFKQDGLAVLPRDVSLGMNLAALAEASAELEDVAVAQLVYDALLPFRDEIVSASIAMILDPVPFFLGLTSATLGNADLAAEHFCGSLVAAEQMGARTTLARTHYAWGLAAKDWRDARIHLERARDYARSLDLSVLADNADRRLREHPGPGQS